MLTGADPFTGFTREDVPTARGAVRVRVGGAGPPVLLLHGYPETSLMWQAVAPQLTGAFTVIAADLPGYGDSFHPPPTADHPAHGKRAPPPPPPPPPAAHAAHGKRALAAALVDAMARLGHETFAVAGHDRGGRVAYRMALDHPERVRRLAVLDVVPTGEVWGRADAAFARGY